MMRNAGWKVLAVLLSLAGAAYLYTGFHRLAVQPDVPRVEAPFACDLSLRWREQLWMFDRLDAHRAQETRFGMDPNTEVEKDPEGIHYIWGYPPWSYGMGWLIAPPLDWSLVRWYFAFLNILALAVIARWTLRSTPERPLPHQFTMVALSLSSIAYLYCLSNGQTGILIVALLILMAEAVHQRRPILAGLCAAGAMYKPQLGALFMLILLIRREFLAMGIAAATGVLAMLLAWWMTGHAPLDFLRATWIYGREFPAHDLAGLFSILGISRTTAVVILLAAGLMAAVSLLCRFRYSDIRIQLAIVAAISMFWSYHKAYDFVAVTLIIVPLAGRVMQEGSSWLARFSLILLAGTSLLPLRMSQHGLPAVQLLYAIAVFVGLGVLLSSERRLPKIEPRRKTCSRSDKTGG